MPDLPVAFGGDRDDRRLARHRFLNVGDGLLPEGVLRDKGDHRQLLVQQSDRAMLHLARGIGLRVEIGYLLQLQRALKRRRIGKAASDEEEAARVREIAGQRLDLLLLGKHRRKLAGNIHQRRGEPPLRIGLQIAAQLREIEAEQRQHRHLRGEGLRRRDADLRAGGGDQRLSHLAVDRRAAYIGDHQTLRTVLLREPRRVQRVRRLSRLGYEHRQRLLVYRDIPVPVLRGHLGAYLKIAKRLHNMRRDDRRVM